MLLSNVRLKMDLSCLLKGPTERFTGIHLEISRGVFPWTYMSMEMEMILSKSHNFRDGVHCTWRNAIQYYTRSIPSHENCLISMVSRFQILLIRKEHLPRRMTTTYFNMVFINIWGTTLLSSRYYITKNQVMHKLLVYQYIYVHIVPNVSIDAGFIWKFRFVSDRHKFDAPP